MAVNVGNSDETAVCQTPEMHSAPCVIIGGSSVPAVLIDLCLTNTLSKQTGHRGHTVPSIMQLSHLTPLFKKLL